MSWQAELLLYHSDHFKLAIDSFRTGDCYSLIQSDALCLPWAFCQSGHLPPVELRKGRVGWVAHEKSALTGVTHPAKPKQSLKVAEQTALSAATPQSGRANAFQHHADSTVDHKSDVNLVENEGQEQGDEGGTLSSDEDTSDEETPEIREKERLRVLQSAGLALRPSTLVATRRRPPPPRPRAITNDTMLGPDTAIAAMPTGSSISGTAFSTDDAYTRWQELQLSRNKSFEALSDFGQSIQESTADALPTSVGIGDATASPRTIRNGGLSAELGKVGILL